MPFYEVELDDGSVYEVESDSDPSPDELSKVLASTPKRQAPQFSLDSLSAPAIPRSGEERAAQDFYTGQIDFSPFARSREAALAELPAHEREQRVQEETWRDLTPGERFFGSDMGRFGRAIIGSTGKVAEAAGTFDVMTTPAPIGEERRQQFNQEALAKIQDPATAPELRDFYSRWMEHEVPAPTTGDRIAAHPFVQRGRAISEAVEKMFPPIQPESVSRPVGAVLEGIGSSLPILVAGVATAGAGVIPVGAAIEFQDAFDREIERQNREKEPLDYNKALFKSAGYAAIASSVEQGLGVGRLLRNARKAFGSEAEGQLARELATKPAREAIKSFAARRVKDVGANSAEEGLQRFAQDMIVEGKPEWGSILHEAAVGGVAGPVMGGVLETPGTVAQMASRPQEAAGFEDLRQGQRIDLGAQPAAEAAQPAGGPGAILEKSPQISSPVREEPVQGAAQVPAETGRPTPDETRGQEVAPQNDADRYDELVSQLRSAPMEQKFAMSSEIEQIKNRHGGKPPVRVTAETGKSVAENLGLRWEGVQEWPGLGPLFGFTYLKEGSPAHGATFYAKPGATATDVQSRMRQKVAEFESPGEAPSSTVGFFPRRSEAQGLGEQALGPSVEDVRQQRRMEATNERVLTQEAVDEISREFEAGRTPPPVISPPATGQPGEQKRAQVFGRPETGQLYTPSNQAETRARIKAKVFDSTKPITAEQTAAAWKLINDWSSPQTGLQTAQGILNAGENTLAFGQAQQELFDYALDLAARRQPEMMNRLLDTINLMPTPGGDTGMSEVARILSGRSDFDNPMWHGLREAMKQREVAIEKKAGKKGAAAVGEARKATDSATVSPQEVGSELEGRKPVKTVPQEQADRILDKYAKSQSDTLHFSPKEYETIKETFRLYLSGDATAGEFRATLQSLGVIPQTIENLLSVADRENTIVNLQERIKRDEAIKRHRQNAWKKWVRNITERAQRTAESLVEKYERVSSGAEWLKPGNRNRVRDIVKAAMSSQEPILADPSPWINLLRDELVGAGVDTKTATRLANEVAQARQTQFANTRLRQMEGASVSQSTASLTESIVSQPLSNQNDPQWRKETALRWFMSNGLSREQAETASKLYNEAFERALGNARVKIAEPILERGEVRNRDEILKLIRAGPDWFTKLAQQNGWKGFTTDQLQRMAELDRELSNTELDPHQTAKLNNELFGILRKGSIPKSTLYAIAEGFTASMFSGLRTFTINAFTPPFAMLRNYLTDISSNPGNAGALTRAFKSSLKSALPEFKWAWMNNAFSLQQNEYIQQSGALADMMNEGISDIRKGDSAKGAAKFIYGSQQYVLRWMGALDQAWRVAEKEYKTALYTSLAMKEAGYSNAGIDRIVDSVMATKQQAFEDALASGMNETDALVRANDAVNDAYYDALASLEDSKTAGTMREAARKDADAIVGFKSQDVSEQEEGMFSRVFMNRFMEFASGLFSSKNALERIGGRMAIGVVNVPYRTLRYFSNYSPYGLIRYAVHQNRVGKGKDTLWNQTFSNHLQARQRLNEAIAGTVLMAVMPLLASRTADDDDDNKFGIYVTGKGPEKTTDPIVRDAWLKKFKPFSITVKVGDKYVSIPLGRTGEALLWPLALTGAFDDFAMKQKQHGGKKTPGNLDQTAEVAGSYFQSMFQRGVFSSFAKLGEFGGVRSGQPLRKMVESAAYSAGPLIPWKGAMQSLTRLLSDPVDRSSMQGAILANSPIIGPMIGQPAINALGDPIMDQTVSGKMYGEGFPLVFRVSNPDHPAYRLIIKHGQGPPTPQRSNVEATYGELTPRQWYDYNKEYGARIKLWMGQNFEELNKLSAEQFNDRMGSYGTIARGRVVEKMGLKSVR